MKLNSIKIERFKATWQPPAVDLHPLTVVIGRNGSGKSSLIEALEWIDTTIREDARKATERFRSVNDLINKRGSWNEADRRFDIELQWEGPRGTIEYHLQVASVDDEPRITLENMTGADGALITTADGVRTSPLTSGLSFSETDRLAVARLGVGGDEADAIRDFWVRAVFLRLNANRLAKGSDPTRGSRDPLLDEEGLQVGRLIHDLSDQGRERLVEGVKSVLSDMREVQTTDPSPTSAIHWGLKEEMLWKGRAGKYPIEVPSWMLSEGTRRITAIFAILEAEPAPSLLCIEEIENGLDPWTLRQVMRRIRHAVDHRGIQVILTTHSPWLLDAVDLDHVVVAQRSTGDTTYVPLKDQPVADEWLGILPPGALYLEMGSHGGD